LRNSNYALAWQQQSNSCSSRRHLQIRGKCVEEMKRRAVTGGKGRNEERGKGETAKRTKGTPEHTHTRALTLWASECVCWLFFLFG